MTVRVIVVEDEPLVRALFERTLAQAGFAVSGAGDACTCRALLRDGPPVDLVTLDLGLPDLDGLQFARELRAAGDVGLMVISREQTPESRVAALDLGCDDYMVKPVHLGELCARAQAVIRRRRAPQRRRVGFGGLVLDAAARTVEARGGQCIALTRGEFSILALLAAAEGRVVGREQLLAPVSRNAEEADLRTVDALIRRIRRKLEAHARGDIIVTAPGIGYRLGVPIEDAQDD